MRYLNVRDPIKIEFGFEHRATGSCPVAKRMSKNFDEISDIEISHLPAECSKNSKTGNFKQDQYKLKDKHF